MMLVLDEFVSIVVELDVEASRAKYLEATNVKCL